MPSEVQANAEQRARLAAHLIARMCASWQPLSKPAGRDRFILFAPTLVTAILEGRKTVTRRLVTPPGEPRGSCPFGGPGDRLWVREKWGYHDEFFDQRARGTGRFVYAADGPPAGSTVLAWKPSLHMPRAACRVVLHIIATRTERLTQLSPEDATAEGCPDSQRADPVAWFRALWDSITVDRGNGWATDPWVWVIHFRAVRQGAV